MQLAIVLIPGHVKQLNTLNSTFEIGLHLWIPHDQHASAMAIFMPRNIVMVLRRRRTTESGTALGQAYTKRREPVVTAALAHSYNKLTH